LTVDGWATKLYAGYVQNMNALFIELPAFERHRKPAHYKSLIAADFLN
jgi:hypothetical protein